MIAFAGVSTGVTVGRVVAATHLSALEADPQMEPRIARLQAFLASLDGLGELGDPDLI
jgi:hypothetical protein